MSLLPKTIDNEYPGSRAKPSSRRGPKRARSRSPGRSCSPWIGEIGEQKAELTALLEESSGQFRNAGARVAATPMLGRRVDCADSDAVRGGSGVGRHGDYLTVHIPEQ